MGKTASTKNQSNSRRLQAQKAQQAQKREEKKLRQTIKDLQKAAKDTSILADMPTKGLGIILGDVPEELSKIIDHQPENKVELKYFGKTLERLWYYLNFYRESNEIAGKLRKKAKYLVKEGNHKVKVTAFKINTEEDSKILNSFSGREAIFYTTDALEIFDLERLLFIESSRYLLEYGDLRLFQTASGLKFINKLLKLKAWIFDNFSKEEFDRFLVIGSTILFSFGIRVPTRYDIDLYIENSLKKQKNKPWMFDQSFIRRFQRKKKKAPKKFFKSIDITLKGFGHCKEYHTICDFHTQCPKKFGAEDINEVINNQKFHYFFLGLKCVSFHGIVEKQTRRHRKKAYADLLYMRTQNRLLNLLPDKTWDTHISCLPENIHRHNKFDQKIIALTPEKHDEIYIEIQDSLKQIYNYDMELEKIKKIIIGRHLISQIMVDEDCKTMQILRKFGIEPSDIPDVIC